MDALALAGDVGGADGRLPFHADLLALRGGGHSYARRLEGRLAGGVADLPVQSLGRMW
ncbi:MAG: hypothetical protein JWR19_4186 [Pedosphaera sp.]|nr:hypothetical protein [Pedosphaera sp.]